MPEPLTLRIISPDRVVLDEQVDSVRLPGVDGSFGILARHAPMIAAIVPGVLHYRQGGAEKLLFVSDGFCEVEQIDAYVRKPYDFVLLERTIARLASRVDRAWSRRSS